MATSRPSKLDPDLVALLNGWASAPCRAVWRMAVADWFADRPDLRGTLVEFHRPPVGFATRVPRRPWRHRGSPRANLIRWLGNVRIDRAPPLGYWGRTRVGGVPALVTYPDAPPTRLEVVAATVESWFGCPVTYDAGGPNPDPDYARLAVWHVVPAPTPAPEYVHAN